MARGQNKTPKGKKDPFEALPEDFKAKIRGMGDENDVRQEVARISFHRAALQELKKVDQDVIDKHEAYTDACKTYTDGEKEAKLMIAFCRSELKGRGKNIP